MSLKSVALTILNLWSISYMQEAGMSKIQMHAVRADELAQLKAGLKAGTSALIW